MERKLKNEIIKASDSIRKKYRQLKSGIEEESFLARKHFEPLIKPLETLIDLTGKNKKEMINAVKMEEPKEELAEELNEERVDPAEHGRRKARKSKKKRAAAPAGRVESSEGDSMTTSDEGEVETSPYHENVYEASSDEDEKKRWEEWKEYLAQFGGLTQEYLNAMLKDTKKHFDFKYGPHMDKDKMQWRIGNTPIYFDNEDYIHIGGAAGYDGPTLIPGRRGLFELLFKKMPNKKLYNNKDLEDYRDILQLTHAHLQGYNPQGRIASSSGIKYNTIISPLFVKKGGTLLPVTDNKIDYVHWDNPNELVKRLALLTASQEAGNNGHQVEIASIEEELREGNFIQ